MASRALLVCFSAAVSLAAAGGVAACGGGSPPPQTAKKGPVPDCEEDPTPLKREYTGLASSAKCDREIYSIMGGVTFALGTNCSHCHEQGDYAADTEMKRVANWMATELVPSLRTKDGKEPTCRDCHFDGEKGHTKLLGEPRDPAKAKEVMSHLVASFETADGRALECKMCHGAASPTDEGWQGKVIGTDHLPGKDWAAPAPAAPEEPASDGGAPAPAADGGATQ